jgi:hypothetical protein
MNEDRDCNGCINGTRDGNCAAWDCEFIPREEAVSAVKVVRLIQERELTGEVIKMLEQ